MLGQSSLFISLVKLSNFSWQYFQACFKGYRRHPCVWKYPLSCKLVLVVQTLAHLAFHWILCMGSRIPFPGLNVFNPIRKGKTYLNILLAVWPVIKHHRIDDLTRFWTLALLDAIEVFYCHPSSLSFAHNLNQHSVVGRKKISLK